MLARFTLFLIVLFIVRVSAQPGYQVQASGTTKNVYSINFVSPDTGWAIGDSGLILKTNNSGQVWTPQTSGVTTKLSCGHFKDGANAVIYSNGLNLVTTNGGVSWVASTTKLIDNLLKVYFKTPSTGIGMSEGSIYKTDNNGSTWTSAAVALSNRWTSMFFLDTVNGWISTGLYPPYTPTYGEVKRLTNGDLPMTSLGPYGKQCLYDVFFVDQTHGWTVGDSGTVFRTTDAGSTWETQNSSTFQNLRSVYFRDRNNGLIAGASGTLLSTTDGGTNWKQLANLTQKTLRTIAFPDKQNGWVVGDNGTIIKFTYSATEVMHDKSDHPKTGFALGQNYPNPFNPTTTIHYVLPDDAMVTLNVYTVLGAEVACLVHSRQTAGTHSAQFNAENLPSGIYYYTLQAGTTVATKKLILLK